jgi:phage gp36-like protein
MSEIALDTRYGLLLHTKTQELVRNRPRALTYRLLAERANDLLPDDEQITPAWLEQFATGRIKAPSVNKVQRLFEVLSGKPLLA